MIKSRLNSWSDTIARLERFACCALVAALVILILLNVATRAFNMALFWVDELAVYTMIWMTLLGASLLLHERRHVSVTLLISELSEGKARALLVCVDVLVLAFAVGLFAMCVAWYDLVALSRYGFDTGEFAGGTYNFIYQEPTNTIGIQKYWVWMIVPIVSLTMTLHALKNLVQDSTSLSPKS